MKKSILLLFAALLPLVTNAHDFEVNGIYYNITSEEAKQAEVTFKGGYSYSYNEYSGSITIPATVTHNGVKYSVTNIGDDAFNYCRSLTTITIPEGVTSIGTRAFRECSSLTSITLPESVTSIGWSAFEGCSKLSSITIPESVTSIGWSAFEGCSKLSSITIPESVTSIEDSAFAGCRSLTAIVVAEGNKVYDSRGGCNAIIETASNTLISGCSTTIIPASVTSIGYGAFSGCSSLTAITIPESETSIESYAFYGCSSLTTINIPEGVTSIGYAAFDGCSSLTTIVLPKSVWYINDEAFADCSELSDVYCYAESVPSIVSSAFSGCSLENATLHVPASAVESYKSTAPWSSFGKIESIKVPVSEITLSHTSVTLTEEVSLTLEATVTPNDASDPSVTWSSSDEDVAMVSSKGRVITLAAGTTTITATANDGSGVSASCEVRVVLGKCDTPTISYEDGRFSLTCATEGAEIRTNVFTENDNEYIGTEFDYIPTHTFTAYATKANYEDSDVATLTLCWIPCDENHEESDGIVTIPSKPVLISARDGVLTLSGLAEGTEVAVVTTSGTAVATATATNGTATLATNLTAGTIAIVKIGEHSIKVVIK